MPAKKKPVSRATAPVWIGSKDPAVRHASKAVERGDLGPLIQIWKNHELNTLIPLELRHLMLQVLERATIMIKRQPGRPKLTTRLHDEAEREEIVKSVNWLLKIRPGMSKKHARHLIAKRYNFDGGTESLIKKYCLAFGHKPR